MLNPIRRLKLLVCVFPHELRAFIHDPRSTADPDRPDIVEAILDGRQGSDVAPVSVLEPIPINWAEQRAHLGADLQAGLH